MASCRGTRGGVCIADTTNNVVINVVEANDDGPLSGGELQRVAQKIAEHLKDARAPSKATDGTPDAISAVTETPLPEASL